MSKETNDFHRLMDRAYIRDGKNIHYGEAVLLACVMHVRGAGRKSKDMEDIQRIFNDPNLDK